MTNFTLTVFSIAINVIHPPLTSGHSRGAKCVPG